jgi:hypothetical protein
LDEHQDHFVADKTIIKVRSVNEATDHTVSLPVPTAMPRDSFTDAGQ